MVIRSRAGTAGGNSNAVASGIVLMATNLLYTASCTRQVAGNAGPFTSLHSNNGTAAWRSILIGIEPLVPFISAVGLSTGISLSNAQYGKISSGSGESIAISLVKSIYNYIIDAVGIEESGSLADALSAYILSAEAHSDATSFADAIYNYIIEVSGTANGLVIAEASAVATIIIEAAGNADGVALALAILEYTINMDGASDGGSIAEGQGALSITLSAVGLCGSISSATSAFLYHPPFAGNLLYTASCTATEAGDTGQITSYHPFNNSAAWNSVLIGIEPAI